MTELTIADRIKKVLSEKNATITSIARTDTERVNITRQLNGHTKVSLETVNRLLEHFPDISSEYIMRGKGEQERTRIINAPAQHQDIHVSEGGNASITQSGVAHLVVNDEPLGNESLAALLVEKDERIAELEKNISVLKETIRILSSK